MTTTMSGKMSIETKAHMDNDYDYYEAKQQMNNHLQPPPPPPQKSNGGTGMTPLMPVLEQRPSSGTPPRHPIVSPEGTPDSRETEEEEEVDTDEALLDLAQLEELHHEAERMKALGNKHMAAQEYTRAYNAYSAALQLSPVGPSSHVFLSNRSAALLSLKRYSTAATDARRAIALAPTFGKAHARLGQSLYFLKDYEGAVIAYEDAIHYEPDNPVTRTYLEKAKNKLQRYVEKQARASRGEEMSVLTSESSIQATVVNSVATDPNASAAVIRSMGYRGHSNALVKAVGGGLTSVHEGSLLADTFTEEEEDEDDPDFDEAVRIQERANKYLSNKNYKYAIEEYTAALFLVPDDDNLSPDLHLGRAHALNGSRRHESAKIDAQLAIKIKPSPEAYSTLAKSLFYMKDFEGAIVAFSKCKEMLPDGESLSMFDRAYLQKSETALAGLMRSEDSPSPRSSSSVSSVIPKLKPPRFVPREEALSRTPNMPSMPKQWPQQSSEASKVLQCGPERNVLFLSEALGIKLNRGPDGIVRVIDVSPDVPGSPIARKGHIAVGDIIREAGGVDIRRPLTNIMWGDTVALIKMAPRPIVLVVAKELTELSIVDQRRQAAANAVSPTTAQSILRGESKVDYGFYPSASSGENSVKQQMEKSQAVATDTEENQVPEATADPEPTLESLEAAESEDVEMEGESAVEEGKTQEAEVAVEAESPVEVTAIEIVKEDQGVEQVQVKEHIPSEEKEVEDEDPPTEKSGEDKSRIEAAGNNLLDMAEEEKELEVTTDEAEAPDTNEAVPGTSLRDEELNLIGAEIMFERKPNPSYGGWDNLRWLSYAGVRKVKYCQLMSKCVPGRKTLFWSADQYVVRILAVYEEPNIILVLRAPTNLAELRELLDLPTGAKIEDPEKAMDSFVVVESVVDPTACKLRVSPLTTVTSILSDVKEDDMRRRSCFELVTPTETVILSAVRLRPGAERALTNFNDSGAFLETSAAEHALKKAICNAHILRDEVGSNSDLSWKHQIILGTLHAFVVLGNQSFLDKAIAAALRSQEASMPEGEENKYLDPRIVDALDDNGRSPLYYACSSRSGAAVESLVKAGANVDLRTEPDNMTLCHICAQNLDHRSLAAVLAVIRRPNVIDALNRTPMYLAVLEGQMVGGRRNPEALDRCLAVLEQYGGQVGTKEYRHPASNLSSEWRAQDVDVLLNHVNYRYPLAISDASDKSQVGISLSASFHYPIHASLVSLRKKIKAACNGENVQQLFADCTEPESRLIMTLQTLLSRGFEPNERIEGLGDTFAGSDELAMHIGYAPIQILAAAALDISAQKDLLGDTLHMSILEFIANVTEFLIKNGARLSLDPPSAERSPLRAPSSSFSDNSAGSEVTDDPVNRSTLKNKWNKQLEELLGKIRLHAAQQVWNCIKTAKSSGKAVIHQDNKSAIEDSDAPGGSDEKSCSICWKAFGKLVNRRHRCRITTRHVCDECSSKRIVEVGEEHRISDGQFLLGLADEAKDESLRLQAEKEQARTGQSQTAKIPANSAAARLDRLEAEEKVQRESLFGGVMEKMAKAVRGESEEEAPAEQIGGLSAQLGQTKDALNERGEKLNTLAEKSDKLVNASKDFATMAKELNKASHSQGLFW